MKLDKDLKNTLPNANVKLAANKSFNVNAESLKSKKVQSKKVQSKKNNLDEDEQLNKEVDIQQADANDDNKTTANVEGTVISSGDKVAAADSATRESNSASTQSNPTTIAAGSSGMSNYALAGLVGLGAIGVAAAASSGGGGHSNTSDILYAYEGFSHAIGGAGDTIINLSTLTYTNQLIDLSIIDIAGGNDTLISGVAGWFELDGGIGNDILDARLSANADLSGGDGNDILYGAQFSNEYTGGKGADKITGSTDAQSENIFLFKQGDSTSVSFIDQASAGLGNGDKFTFNSSADIILSGLKPAQHASASQLYGDSINLYSNSYDYLDSDLLQMPVIPFNGLVTDQGYFFQQGSYAEATGIFTVNDSGVDTLIVYDGDATAGVSQTALVLANTNSAHLTTDSWSSNIYLDPPVIG